MADKKKPDRRSWRPPKGADCEYVNCGGDWACPNKAVVVLYDGPDDEVGTAYCAECASGGE